MRIQTHPDAVDAVGPLDEKPRTGDFFQYSSDRTCKHSCNVSDRWVETNQPTDKAKENEVPRHSFVPLCTFARFVSRFALRCCIPLFLHQVPSTRRPPWLVSLSSVLLCLVFFLLLCVCVFFFSSSAALVLYWL
jgi:hypothetical protein